jgi:hypothetical protein
MVGRKTPKELETSPEILMLAYLCVKEVEGLGPKVEVLDRFGLADSQLASVCSVGEQAIRDARHRQKKIRNSAKRKKKGE